MSKDFKTYNEQIDLLRSKGLTIYDEDFALTKLKDISYFALINGYKEIFKNNKNSYYIAQASFEDIVKLFNFDEELRSLLLRYILKIERKMKSFISYYFSQKYPNCKDYLEETNYNYSVIKNRNDIKKLIGELETSLSSKKYSYIRHYHVNHNGDIPLWVLVNSLSFGKISHFYALSQQGIQQQISNEFSKISNAELGNMLSVLALFRNVCAHNERLFNYKSKQALKNNRILNTLKIPHKGTNYVCGDNDLFSIVVCFKSLLNKEDFDSFYKQLKEIIFSIDYFSASITRVDILKKMGFPKNWEMISQI